MTDNGKIFYSISEIAERADVTPQTIRNWSKYFSRLRVKKDKNGRRMFTGKNLEIIEEISYYKKQGYTNKAIKRIFSGRVDKNIENIIIKINSLIKRIDKITK